MTDKNALIILYPDIVTLIDNNPTLAASTKAQYAKAIVNALDADVNLADPHALADYAQGLNTSSRSFLKAAIRLWGDRITLEAKTGATPATAAAVQATVYRVEALNEAIQVKQPQGQKAHTWLTQSEVKRLLDSCNPNTIRGQRDKVILGLLLGAGLRREELVNLTFGDIILQPVAGRIRTVLNIRGKGAKDRIVPIRDSLAAALDGWGMRTGPGRIARAVTRGDAIRESISAIGIFHIVGKSGLTIGKPSLAPHDLRRSFAQLGYEAGVPITQISLLLGHASVTTTQRYLNLDLDLETTVSDFIPFE